MKPRIIRGQTTPEFHRVTLKDRHFAELAPVSLTIAYGKYLTIPLIFRCVLCPNRRCMSHN